MRTEGKVVIVTGAGRGIGRGEALEFARQGARVVVNDYGVNVHGEEPSSEAANAVVEEIRAAGGEAVANAEDVSDFDGAGRLVRQAIDTYGGLDVLVNNAGILRDRTIANMSIDEWDAVVRVHLRGTFAPMRHAAEYWKGLAKSGVVQDARIINTSSGSGLMGNPGQGNYGAAKAGIAALTIIAAQELLRYGVYVNAIAPTALSRMTEDRPFAQKYLSLSADDFNPLAPENVAPTVVWLGSEAAKGITGRVFMVAGGSVAVAEPWHTGPGADKGALWEVEELDEVIPGLLAQATEQKFMKPLVRQASAAAN
ncbi:SDR family oxidoreductase [Paractinoplanes globisporus]|uniref:SDR family oxidoreductase n=1 Tax=Paractinoplanes globisporus TaxID=113565 RepID=A0ABW6W8D9_9ACTN|nr:SDR family oxidoreductase [Actinoplanes globisporus]